MNRDDTLRMAREAGMVLGYPFLPQHLEGFHALAIAAEREAFVHFLECMHEAAAGQHNHYLIAANQFRILNDERVSVIQLGDGNAPALPEPEPDLEWCPMCGGPADNGFDRCFPPNPYLCTRCLRA